MPEPIDLATANLHLGLGARVDVLADFEWTAEYLAAYTDRTAGDGDEGRLVLLDRQERSWDTWERHPAGEEVVILVSGRVDLHQEIDGEVQRGGAHRGHGGGEPAERVAHRRRARAR